MNEPLPEPTARPGEQPPAADTGSPHSEPGVPPHIDDTAPALSDAASLPDAGEPVVPPDEGFTRRELAYWGRTLALGIAAATVYGLSRWVDQRIPLVPRLPANVRLASPTDAAGTPVDPALATALTQLSTGLARLDVERVARLAAPSGVQVASYTGLLPELQAPRRNPQPLLRQLFVGTDAQPRVLGWHRIQEQLVLVLTDGWQQQSIPGDSRTALESTPLMAFWLTAGNGQWSWQALAPDPDGLLAQQARQIVWQPMPIA